MKTTIILTVLVFVMMSGMAGAAVLEEDWAYGKRNAAPDGIEHAYWDFENGAGNLFPLNNQHPDVAAFLPVTVGNPDTIFETDEPSSVWDRGRAMHIYPWDHYWQDTAKTIPVDYIYIVNGHYAFSPRTGPDMLGKYWPGRKAYVDFKADTHYVSFLACTGGTMTVNLYDKRGKSLSSARIYANIDRVGSEPSEFTRFEVHLPDKEIGSMSLTGSFNGWNIDDLIVGGEPGYLGHRTDYGYAAERMKQLIGAPFNEYAIGYDLIGQEFLTAEQIMDGDQSYYDPNTGEIEHDPGIYDQNAIVWAYNVRDGITEHVVNQYDIDKLEKFEFKEEVAYEDIQPGDVLFIDYPPADGQYDEVGMVIPEQIDPVDGELVDCIRVLEDGGVQYGSTEKLNLWYDVVDGFVDYRCLSEKDRVGKCPYPKPQGKPI